MLLEYSENQRFSEILILNEDLNIIPSAPPMPEENSSESKFYFYLSYHLL